MKFASAESKELARFILPLLAMLSTALLSAACSPSSPKLMPPAEVYTELQANGGDFKVDFNPKVDILFVIDNSASMIDSQEALSKNIDRFVEAFAQNEIIDFHIGITTVFDSVRQYPASGTQPSSFKFWPNGQLRPVRELPSGQEVASSDKGSICKTTDDLAILDDPGQPGFITRQTPNYLRALRTGLKVGVRCLDRGGPEYEEVFSPVYEALSEPMRNGPNQGFYREDAHLAVILISDANPSNNDVEAGELHRFLRELKGNNPRLLSTHGVFFPLDREQCTSPVSNNRTITRDPGNEPAERMVDFLKLSKGTQMSLCDGNYGDKLAEIGKDIQRRTLGRVIHLNKIPEFNTIQVGYGSQTIPRDWEKGWTYDPRNVALVISGDVNVKPEPGARIWVRFTPVHLQNLRNGRAKRVNGNGASTPSVPSTPVQKKKPARA
jgi:hypothetical protein